MICVFCFLKKNIRSSIEFEIIVISFHFFCKMFEWRRATVIGVFSGDTICVKYADFSKPLGIIRIAGVQAPNLSFYTSTGMDEPYGIEAWSTLRQHLKSKNVLVQLPPISTKNETIKIPLLGELPIITTYVKTATENEDLTTFVLSNGSAKCIDEKDNRKVQISKNAQTKGLGLWSNAKRKEVTPREPNKIYQETPEFNAILIDFDTNCIATLFLPDDVSIIELEVS